MIEHETVTGQGNRPTHGEVQAVKEVPTIKLPFVTTGVARGFAALRPYRCRECGARVP
jgi:hypothetical protein